MKILFRLLLVCFLFCFGPPVNAQNNDFDLEVVTEFSLGEKVGLLRAVPVQISPDQTAIFVAYSADKDIDPYIEMFYPPTDHLKFALYSLDGKLIWKKELDNATLNGIWFTPIYPFDLDNNGIDEIYYVKNTDSIHILSYDHLRLEALDARTGDQIDQWNWQRTVRGTNSHTFRNFIFGGYAQDEPVLITAQGTYGRMGLQAWEKGMNKKWDLIIEENEPGARGSHMSPVVDINHDGTDEIMWGERCLNIKNGEYLFIADKNQYNGHSDVVQPTLNRNTGKWSIFTCRESGSNGAIKPRVVMYNNKGEKIWSDLDKGHMDMGWTAHVNTDTLPLLAFTISRGGKKAGPQGFFRLDVKEYVYNALTGERVKLPFAAYNTVPVDLNGDGYHEFACAQGEQADRNIYTFSGDVIGHLGASAYIAVASKFMDLPGEQLLCYYPDGTIKIWADKNAKDTEIALKRYQNPFYKMNQKMTAQGYNLTNLGGL